MTAEILIMNKSAIAMAADSAVTVEDKKTYNGVNKLFMLCNDPPMGIMVYGNAEFIGIPLETLIKEYRKIIEKEKYETINQFINNFFELILRYVQTKTPLNEYYDFQKKLFKESIEAQLQNIGEDEKKELLNINKNDIDPKIKSLFDITDLKKFKGLFEEIVENEFNNISKNEKKELIECLEIIYIKFLTASHTGIVIAGFNKEDVFPSYVSYSLFNIFENKLKFRKLTEINNHNGGGYIIPFAQRGVMDTFLAGFDMSITAKLGNFLKETIDGYPDMILNALDENKFLSTKKIKNIGRKKDKLKKGNDKILKKFSNLIETSFQESYTPILDSIAALPKEELGEMCESLIHITSLRTKVSKDLESVGGDIDVAIISKGDGFIWTKRKHYFDEKLNPHFFNKR